MVLAAHMVLAAPHLVLIFSNDQECKDNVTGWGTRAPILCISYDSAHVFLIEIITEFL